MSAAVTTLSSLTDKRAVTSSDSELFLTTTFFKLSTIEDVYEFVRVASESDTEVDVKQKHYTVNGKSIIGIFSLDLTQPIQLIVKDGICSQFEKFRYKGVVG